ncbi:hypothetical protein IPdc08_00598 [archaeon]|nr:hypothetical protein IPdc08_00598 [archaeon]
MSRKSRLKKQLLRSIKTSPKTFWQLIPEQDFSLKELVNELEGLIRDGVIEYKNNEFLLNGSTELKPRQNVRCGYCSGSGLKIDNTFEEALRKFEKLTENRPLPIAEYDQGLMHPVYLAKKAAFMYERGDIEGEEIIVLGDDDLFSLYAALTGLPEKITVIELDDRITGFIKKIAAKEKVKIEVLKKDLSRAIGILEESFSVFVSEPPESLLGLKMFVRAGMSTIKNRGAGYVGLTTLESSLSKWLSFEEWLLSNNAVITDILRDFSLYPEDINKWSDFYSAYPLMKKTDFKLNIPESDWYASSLLRIEKVERENFDEEDIYMDEETIVTPGKGN